MTITEFLEARITEDEAAIKNAPTNGDYFDVTAVSLTGQLRARLLAECAAKRAIIREHSGLVEGVEKLSAALPGELNRDAAAPWRTGILRALAAVYADHSDYSPDWAV